MRPVIAAFNIQPLEERLLVKPYVMPEVSPGGIIIPDTVRTSKWSHFEYVKGSAKALKRLGLRSLHAGAILCTRFHAPADSGFDDEADGQPLFFLNAEEVEQIVLWQDDDENDVSATCERS